MTRCFASVYGLAFCGSFVASKRVRGSLLLLIIFCVTLGADSYPLVHTIGSASMFAITVGCTRSSYRFGVLPFMLIDNFRNITIRVLKGLNCNVYDVLGYDLEEEAKGNYFKDNHAKNEATKIEATEPSGHDGGGSCSGHSGPPAFMSQQFIFSATV